MVGLDERTAKTRISRYENGIHGPHERIARKIAEVLGYPLAYFYCDDDRLADIVRAYTEADEAGRQRLAALAAELVTPNPD
jgi:transcriptional regulator with XRE-family HTH domain